MVGYDADVATLEGFITCLKWWSTGEVGWKRVSVGGERAGPLEGKGLGEDLQEATDVRNARDDGPSGFYNKLFTFFLCICEVLGRDREDVALFHGQWKYRSLKE